MCIFYESLFEIESNGFWGESFEYFFFKFLLARIKVGYDLNVARSFRV